MAIYPRIEVFWRDHFFTEGTEYEIDAPQYLQATCGYLVYEDQDRIVIAQTYSEDGGKSERITLEKCLITDRVELVAQDGC